jgi:hypothetical protein
MIDGRRICTRHHCLEPGLDWSIAPATVWARVIETAAAPFLLALVSAVLNGRADRRRGSVSR